MYIVIYIKKIINKQHEWIIEKKFYWDSIQQSLAYHATWAISEVTKCNFYVIDEQVNLYSTGTNF